MKRDEYQQIWDGSWYKLDDHYLHQCCDCGLAHSVTYKMEKGTLFYRWNINEKETKAARLANRLAAKAKKKRAG